MKHIQLYSCYMKESIDCYYIDINSKDVMNVTFMQLVNQHVCGFTCLVTHNARETNKYKLVQLTSTGIEDMNKTKIPKDVMLLCFEDNMLALLLIVYHFGHALAQNAGSYYTAYR